MRQLLGLRERRCRGVFTFHSDTPARFAEHAAARRLLYDL